MAGQKSKPQGMSGAFGFKSGAAIWDVIPFPETKSERERLIAELFIGGFDRWVAMESEPSLAPFDSLAQNAENDLDFTVQTAAGTKLLELAEFAPLQAHGPTFAHAPKSLSPNEKAALAADLIRMKSQHQGGAGRLLVLYVTEHGFWIDPFAVEILRRIFAAEPPNFDRIYYVSPHDLSSASVTEIYPGKPHHWWGDQSDEELAATAARAMTPHPSEMEVRYRMSGQVGASLGGRRIVAKLTLEVPGRLTIRRNHGSI